jgi:hypothetical protein
MRRMPRVRIVASGERLRVLDGGDPLGRVECDESLTPALGSALYARVPVCFLFVERQAGRLERHHALMGPEHDRFLPAHPRGAHQAHRRAHIGIEQGNLPD